jgi:hypothetical protein
VPTSFFFNFLKKKELFDWPITNTFGTWGTTQHRSLKYTSLPKFFTSKFNYLLFCNPTHKTETGTANRWGTAGNSKPPGPIIMMSQIKTLNMMAHLLEAIGFGHGEILTSSFDVL